MYLKSVSTVWTGNGQIGHRRGMGSLPRYLRDSRVFRSVALPEENVVL
jgi:hypothetical protein